MVERAITGIGSRILAAVALVASLWAGAARAQAVVEIAELMTIALIDIAYNGGDIFGDESEVPIHCVAGGGRCRMRQDLFERQFNSVAALYDSPIAVVTGDGRPRAADDDRGRAGRCT